MSAKLLLDRKRRRYCACRGLEYREHRVAGHVDHAALVFFHLPAEDRTRGIKGCHRGTLVVRHQARVACGVCGKNGRQPGVFLIVQWEKPLSSGAARRPEIYSKEEFRAFRSGRRNQAVTMPQLSMGGKSMRTLVAGLLLLVASIAHAQYPQRPVQLIVPWGAGGGTDATARIIASLLEKELKQPFNVVNRTGGSGVVGHQAIASSPADGYTIGMITVEITMMHWVGLTPLKHTDYTPIGLVNADPAGVHVRVDSPYKSVKDLIAAIKANPGKMKASGTGQGGIWHLAIAGLLKDQGVDPNALPWVPSNGAAPGLQDLVAGGVEVVPCSIPEARAMIDGGKVRALSIMDANPPALYPNVPTLKKELGTDWAIAAWRVIAAPQGIPADVQKTLSTALKKVYDSKEYKDFMASRGFGVIWADPEGTAKFMAGSDASLGAALKAVGLAK